MFSSEWQEQLRIFLRKAPRLFVAGAPATFVTGFGFQGLGL